MAHYAFINENDIVTEVIVGIDETELIEGKHPEIWYGEFRGQTCKRTSYNGRIRKNYAGIGFTYDAQRDAFIPPKPFSKWVLDEKTCQWVAPIPLPTNGFTYVWNDNRGEWELANFAKPNEALEA
jgi:hypothetical protein